MTALFKVESCISVVQGGVMHSNATVVVFCLGDGVVSRFVSLSCSKVNLNGSFIEFYGH
jgi:hypothetical protein